jgi:hypothetical protein
VQLERELLREREKRLRDAGFPEADTAASTRVFSLERDESGVLVSLSARPGGAVLSALVPAEAVAEAFKRAEQAAQSDPDRSERWALDLLGCFLANCHGPSAAALAYDWSEQRVGNGLPDFAGIHERSPLPDAQFEHTDSALIRQVLVEQHGSVIIDGRTGSGKSNLTRQCAFQCVLSGAGLIDLDMIDATDGAESVMSALLTMPRFDWYAVVMEKVDTSLGKAQAVYALVERLRKEHGFDIAVLANGWLDLASGSTIAGRLQLPRGTLKVRTQPKRVFDSLVAERGLTAQQVAELRKLCGDGEDLVLAKLALDFVRRTGGRVPTREEFTGHVAVRFGLDAMANPDEQAALYRFACLGMNEIEVPSFELRFRLSPFVTPFVRRKLIEQADTTYRIGSRSVAKEMARYAYRTWRTPDGALLPPPAQVAADTLRFAGPAQMRAALDRLDYISASRPGAPRAGQMLANAWKRRDQIRTLMARAVDADPEWGDNVASAAFACIALRHLDLEEHWERCADWIRRRWEYESPGTLPMWRGDKSAEKVDFQGMTEAMSREDDLRAGSRAWAAALRGDQVDPDRVHRTWMLGVLLCFEGTAPKLDPDRLDALYESACAVQQANGAFYPERVPWVTARILIGLCLAGYRDTKAAQNAASWLLRDSFKFGWKSGTGAWNTDVMTTAMCVIALLRQGVSATELPISLGLADLDLPAAQRPSEIDTSLIIEARLLGQSEPEARSGAYDLLTELLVWASDEGEWTGAGQPPPFNQPERSGGEGESTRLPFVVSQLLPCIWKMVGNELATLFAEDFDDAPQSPAGPDADPAANGAKPGANTRPETVPPENVPSGNGQPTAGENGSGPGKKRPEPDPGQAPGEAAPDPLLVARARGRMQTIGAQLASDIESRRKAARTRAQQEHLEYFQAKLAELSRLQDAYEDCRAELDRGPVTLELLRRVDALGKLVIGRSYEPVFESSSP